MIESIRLENFKAFHQLAELSLSPVTVLCGTNSCGKTSILQSILLLKQTLESQNPIQTLLLNGRLVHLGSFEDVLFRHDTDQSMTFDLRFRISLDGYHQETRRPSLPIRFMFHEILGGEGTDSMDFRWLITLRSRSSKTTIGQLSSVIVTDFYFAYRDSQRDEPWHEVTLQHQEEDNYRINWKDIFLRVSTGNTNLGTGRIDAKVVFSTFLPVGVSVLSPDKDRHAPTEVLIPLYQSAELLRSILASYNYIGPLREEPSRRYIFEDEVVEIGIKGENAAYIYLTEGGTSLLNHVFYHRETDSFRHLQSVTLQDAVERWLELMNIHGLRPEPSKEIVYLNLASSSASRTRVNIADVGFGVSQIFPIIVEGLRMPVANTLILEQPEIHLHPSLQMQLADYFITLALSRKNVIVETHSDHVINRLVRRLVEDSTGRLKDLIRVYFVTATHDGSKCQPVNIDPLRGIVNWPSGLFDQNADEQERIIRAGLAKRTHLRTLRP
jgi:predicted ATPase